VHAVDQVAQRVPDNDEEPARREPPAGAAQAHRPELDVGREHQVDRHRRRPRERVGDHPLDRAVRIGAAALVDPDGEKSTAVTLQPRAASQRACRPVPAARSTARPGSASCSTDTTVLLGSLSHGRSAYRASQCAASLTH
jgi:hypothetical protein